MSDTFNAWVDLLTDQYKADTKKIEDGYQIKSSSKAWVDLAGTEDIIELSLSPNTASTWEHRIRLVEKATARAVVSAPVGFSCNPVGLELAGNPGANLVTILRLAYGFSLSVGQCLRQRLTAYYVVESGQSFYIVGQDELFDHNPQVQGLDLEDPYFQTSLSPLMFTVNETQEEYCSQASVRNELDKLKRSLSKQLRNLDRLYTVNYGQYARLYGRKTEKLRGEDAIEAEYIDKMEDIFYRHQPTIIFEPLSLGLIKCNVSIQQYGEYSEVTLPFYQDIPFRFTN